MGILSGLQSDPRGTLILLLYQIPAILIALTLHELSHGYVALRCGDPTAQMLGRLSFNPLRHLDPVGTACMVLFGFGWARPVPVNPRNYKRFRRDDVLVFLAGVAMNFCLFLFSTVLLFILVHVSVSPEVWEMGTGYKDFLRFDGWNFYSILSGENVLFITKDGGLYYIEHLEKFMKFPWTLYILRFLMFFTRINLSLAVFNLLPIPPLDGYHVVNDILLRGKLHIPSKVINVIMIGMLAAFYFTSFFSRMISTAVIFVQGGVVSGLLALFGLG